MKQFLTVMQGKKFLLSVSVTLITIWLLGPYLAIAGKVPFGSVNQRIIASIIALVILMSIEYRRNHQVFNTSDHISDEVKQELQTLQQTIINVLRTLYKNAIKSFLFRYKKPWYIVLGPTNAGKSTLLNKAELNLKGIDNLPPMTMTPTKYFNWWLADDAVFIDVGGRYFKDVKETQLNTSLLFQGFFKLLKKYRAFKPINGLILTINLQDLTSNTKDQGQLKRLNQVINELVLQFLDFPIYLIITRSDVIEGFIEFFEDLGPEERNQIFGLSFPLRSDAESLPQLFNDEYNTLLAKLNERVLFRLHQENNADKIAKIKNFPLQMEYLKHPLAKLLNLILPTTQVNLRGIFFASAFQKDKPFDNLTKTLSHAYDIHHTHSSHRTTAPKNFFIPNIFKRIIFPETKFYAQQHPEQHSHQVTSLLVIIITAACLFFFFNSYQYNLRAIRETQMAINDINQQSTTGNQEPLSHQLDVLDTIITQLSKNQGAWYMQVGLQQASKLKTTASSLYDKLLTTQFLNYLQRTLEIQLQNTPEDNANQLYATLKTYLMLGDPTHFDKKFFTGWFDSYWHQMGAQHQELTKHLTALLHKKLKAQPLNAELIQQKRAVLNSMPPSKLILTILQNQYQRSPIQIMPATQATIFKNLPAEIPGIFNILNFKNVYYSQINKTCQEITNGNWVLGQKAQAPFSEMILNQLTTEVKAIYLNEYANIWMDIFNKVKFDDLQNLNQIVVMLELLNNPQSPLVQLINTIRNNTLPISDSVEFTQQVSSRFLALNSLSNDVLKNTNQVSLNTVQAYLSKIVHAGDMERASYDAAKQRMENKGVNDAITTVLQQAHLLPEPLQTWHTTIAAESWRLILKNALNFLNRTWVSSVYPQYQALLDKRYPLFKEATVDIALNDFASFFGTGGTMDSFFKNYLQPFVDNTSLYWEWKNVDGQRLNIPQATLEMFIRGALIQKMFFPEEARVAGISFSLVPVELDPTIQSFTLDLEGQSVLFQKDNEQILSLTWPGPQPNHTEISFVNDQGKKSVLSETGPWSWFKVLDKALLEPTTSPKHFKLTFTLNGSAVHYELYTNGVVNPFIPGILNAFRCPETLNEATLGKNT